MSKKYEEPTKLQLELMINKGMGIKDIQKETHKQFTEIKKLLDQYGLNIEDKRKKYMSRKRTTITPTKVPEKRDSSEIHDRYATVPKLESRSDLTQLHIEQEHGTELIGNDRVSQDVISAIQSMVGSSDSKKKESENMATQEEMLTEINRLETVGLNLEEENKVLKTSNEALMKENEEYQAKIKELKFQLEVVSKNRAYENSGREIKTDDPVSHPNHYCQGGHECIDEMLIVFGVEAVKHFCLLNVWKYRKRALFKNGQQDIEKSDWYMNKYFELSEQE